MEASVTPAPAAPALVIGVEDLRRAGERASSLYTDNGDGGDGPAGDGPADNDTGEA